VFFESLFNLQKPLTPETAADVQSAEGSTYNDQNTPDIPSYPNRILIIGQIGSHESILSTSQRVIYSELATTVERVFEGGSPKLISGQRIVVSLVGGTVELPDGKTISFLTQPKSFSLERDHTYLLALEYHSSGNFYLPVESWDLSTGIVRANSNRGVQRSTHHTSTLIGLTKDQLISKLASH